MQPGSHAVVMANLRLHVSAVVRVHDLRLSDLLTYYSFDIKCADKTLIIAAQLTAAPSLKMSRGRSELG